MSRAGACFSPGTAVGPLQQGSLLSTLRQKWNQCQVDPKKTKTKKKQIATRLVPTVFSGYFPFFLVSFSSAPCAPRTDLGSNDRDPSLNWPLQVGYL
jgi:hypothetical protein